jgi:hypothetical protein
LTCSSTYLAFNECPEVDPDADQIVQAGVGGLVLQQCRQCKQWVDDHPCLQTSMQPRQHSCDWYQWPLQAKAHERKDEVEYLQYGEWFDCYIEIFGEDVPEDLGPEEAFDGSGELDGCCRQDNEPRPVVLDQFAHAGWVLERMKLRSEGRSRKGEIGVRSAAVAA